MASVIVLRDDRADTVYDDRWLSIVTALGKHKISRATEVEYDHALGEWRAVYLATGVTIGSNAHRGQVIDQEVEWLEQQMVGSNFNGGESNESYSDRES